MQRVSRALVMVFFVCAGSDIAYAARRNAGRTKPYNLEPWLASNSETTHYWHTQSVRVPFACVALGSGTERQGLSGAPNQRANRKTGRVLQWALDLRQLYARDVDPEPPSSSCGDP